MRRWLPLTLAVYLPHLLEEHFTRMCDDPIIVFALRWLDTQSPREAAYLVFQVMLALGLLMATMIKLGGRWEAAVQLGLGLALLGEGHHLIRALVTHGYNPGLVTALPMPFLGAVMVVRGVRAWARGTTLTLALSRKRERELRLLDGVDSKGELPEGGDRAFARDHETA